MISSREYEALRRSIDQLEWIQVEAGILQELLAAYEILHPDLLPKNQKLEPGVVEGKAKKSPLH